VLRSGLLCLFRLDWSQRIPTSSCCTAGGQQWDRDVLQPHRHRQTTPIQDTPWCLCKALRIRRPGSTACREHQRLASSGSRIRTRSNSDSLVGAICLRVSPHPLSSSADCSDSRFNSNRHVLCPKKFPTQQRVLIRDCTAHPRRSPTACSSVRRMPCQRGR
jgi:hypothetical protein